MIGRNVSCACLFAVMIVSCNQYGQERILSKPVYDAALQAYLGVLDSISLYNDSYLLASVCLYESKDGFDCLLFRSGNEWLSASVIFLEEPSDTVEYICNKRRGNIFLLFYSDKKHARLINRDIYKLSHESDSILQSGTFSGSGRGCLITLDNPYSTECFYRYENDTLKSFF